MLFSFKIKMENEAVKIGAKCDAIYRIGEQCGAMSYRIRDSSPTRQLTDIYTDKMYIVFIMNNWRYW